MVRNLTTQRSSLSVYKKKKKKKRWYPTIHNSLQLFKKMNVLERFNGILINAAKSLLNDSKRSNKFWEYAIDTENYIHNRNPHSGIHNKNSI